MAGRLPEWLTHDTEVGDLRERVHDATVALGLALDQRDEALAERDLALLSNEALRLRLEAVESPPDPSLAGGWREYARIVERDLATAQRELDRSAQARRG